MKAFKRPEDRVVKENVYLTGGDSAKIKEKYGSLTAALRQLLFDIAVQEKVEEAMGQKAPTYTPLPSDVKKIKEIKTIGPPETNATSNFLANRRKSKLKIE